MRTHRTTAALAACICLLLCTTVFTGYAQSARAEVTDPGQRALILQRVYFSPMELDEGADREAQIPAVYLDAPNLLAKLITTRQPIVLSPDAGQAHSRVRSSIRQAGGSSTEQLTLSFQLLRPQEERLEFETELPPTPVHSEYRRTMEEAAAFFAPHLGRVEPEVQIAAIDTDAQTRELLDQIVFEEAAAAPFEAALWLGIVSKNTDGGDDSGEVISFYPGTHYVAEFSWFPTNNHGLTGNLLFTANDLYSQGEIPNSDGDDAKSLNTIILPGIGYTYRTLGRLSGGFFFGYGAGYALIRALDPLRLWDDTLLDEGESKGYFVQLMTIRPFLSYALNPSWSIKSSLVFFLQPAMLTGGMVDGVNASDIQVINLCIAYRWH